ncbi:MAG: magnesium chelatase, partial [Anaerolineae bacterium]|nr:magnesium chelatase [Anaerolineae bacterium]
EGISFSHPARFILVGTMNPEEGDLRPQLLDRFALSVEIRGIRETRERVAIMERNLAFEADSDAFRQEWLPSEEKLSGQIAQGRKLLDKVTYSSRDLLSIASLTASLSVDGHRADLVILKTARAHAAFEGRSAIDERDIAIAAELALPHRIRRGPFHQTEITMEELQERISNLQGEVESDGDTQPKTSGEGEEQDAQKKKK